MVPKIHRYPKKVRKLCRGKSILRGYIKKSVSPNAHHQRPCRTTPEWRRTTEGKARPSSEAMVSTTLRWLTKTSTRHVVGYSANSCWSSALHRSGFSCTATGGGGKGKGGRTEDWWSP